MEECRESSKQFNLVLGATETNKLSPYGCYIYNEGTVKFNKNRKSESENDWKSAPICKKPCNFHFMTSTNCCEKENFEFCKMLIF